MPPFARRLALAVVIASFGCDRGEAPPDPPPDATEAPPASGAPGASAIASASAFTPEAPPPRPPEPWLAEQLRRGDPRFSAWLDRAEAIRLQILVRVLDAPGKPGKTHAYRADAEYLYPASAIKTFLAVATLAELNRDVDGEIPLGTRIMRCRDDRGGCEPPREDEDDSEGAEAEDGKKKHEKLYLGQELQKLLAYSDNDAYNRLWDILGHRRANEAVVRLGFPGVRLNHKMNAPPDKSLKTLRTTLLVPGKAAIRVPRRVSDLLLAPTDAARLEEGEAYNDAGKRIDEPMSFANKNHASLSDLARLHLSLVRPDHPDALPLGLSDGQREHLLRAMTRPLRGAHADDHAPFGPGVTAVLDPKRVRYISKSGRAYGFHIENAYVEDTESGRAILLTAGCYANDNGVLNDDDYSYDALSRPLLAAIGEEMTRAFLTEDAAVTDDGPR